MGPRVGPITGYDGAVRSYRAWGGLTQRGMVAGGAILASAFASCGGPSSSQCGAAPWSGRCRLEQVTTVRRTEFPVPRVVVQGLYYPIQDPARAAETPPDVTKEFAARARFEADLHAHLERYSEVDCMVRAPPDGSCVPGEMVVSVPAFQPPPITDDAAPRRGAGCAQLEDASAKDQLPEIGRDASSAFPQGFDFEPNSATLSPEGRALAARIAEQMAADPSLECVAIVGQRAPGEPLPLAAERARAVKQAIIQHGTDGNRLMAITATESVYGEGTERLMDAAELRRVMLRSVLHRSPAQSP